MSRKLLLFRNLPQVVAFQGKVAPGTLVLEHRKEGTMGFMNAFQEELVKVANRLTKYLMGLPAEARSARIAMLPAADRAGAAYKVLGNEARQVAENLPGGAGHGAEHVLNVTRNTQDLMRGAAPNVRRRAVLGSMLHDVGREAEGRARKMYGKEGLQTRPELMHSELGGRFVKNFMQKNRAVASFVPGVQHGGVSNIVRAHDADIHSIKPWTERYLGRDTAAGATYMGDKMDALGNHGAFRTISMAKKFHETPAQTAEVVKRNLPKYRKVIDRALPEQRPMLEARLQEYMKTMGDYVRSGGITPVPLTRETHKILKSYRGVQIPENMLAMQRDLEGQGVKFAMSMQGDKRLFEWALKQRLNGAQLRRTFSRLHEHVRGHPSETLQAIYKLPERVRVGVLKMLMGDQ